MALNAFKTHFATIRKKCGTERVKEVVYTRSSQFCWPTNSTDNASHAADLFFSATDCAPVNMADSNDDDALMATY